MIRLFVCGDVMLGRGIDQILPDPCPTVLHESYVRDARDYVALAEEVSGPIPRRVAYAYPWGDALAILDEARPDVRIINLETSITRADVPDPRKGIHYRMSPGNARCLTAARIDACALANNHVLDWGAAGLIETLATLDDLAIAHAGAGRDRGEAMRPAVVEAADRRRVLVFSIGATDAGVPAAWIAGPGHAGVHVVSNLGDELVGQLRALVGAWRDPGSIVVLSIHWGPNWGFEISRAHRELAHRVIDEVGVHVVHGHSSHHVKGIEVHAGQPILYGCGDLVTDYEGIRSHRSFRGDLGLLYLISLDDRGQLVGLDMVPTRMRRMRLSRASPGEVEWLARTLDRCGAPLGTSAIEDGSRLRLRW